MTYDYRGTHDLGEIVGLSYRLYAARFAAFFAIALTTAPLQMLIAVVQRQVASEETESLIIAALQVPYGLVILAATGALVFAANDASAAAPVDFGRSLDAAFERFGALLTTGLLVLALTLASLLAFPFLALWWLVRRDATVDGKRSWLFALVPFALTVFLAVRWTFHPQAVMIERKRNWGALDASAVAVRENWWRVLAILLVVGLIAAGPTVLAGVSRFAPTLVEAIVTAGAFALVLPFLITAQTLLYFDLKARKQTPDDASPV